jgi:bifunctional UDP-N-acetylglucosamine pyrophosphorylase/glucosamine-1-phosphate N-acetyltransferase
MSSERRRCLVIVLAAGEGVRMRSSRPKALHEIAGRSMLAHALGAVQEAGADDIAVVVGPDREDVAQEARTAAPGAAVFVQRERRGTAHAVLAAREAIARGYDDILVSYADIPLLRGATLAAMRVGLAEGAGLVALGFAPADPTGYGRLIERDGRLVAIREHKDVSPQEKAVGLCNAGPIAFVGGEALAMLAAVTPTNAQNEYYLTDLVEIANARGLVVRALETDESEVMGVNDRVQLAATEAALQTRLRGLGP